jgi:hypothetical protein
MIKVIYHVCNFNQCHCLFFNNILQYIHRSWREFRLSGHRRRIVRSRGAAYPRPRAGTGARTAERRAGQREGAAAAAAAAARKRWPGATALKRETLPGLAARRGAPVPPAVLRPRGVPGSWSGPPPLQRGRRGVGGATARCAEGRLPWTSPEGTGQRPEGGGTCQRPAGAGALVGHGKLIIGSARRRHHQRERVCPTTKRLELRASVCGRRGPEPRGRGQGRTAKALAAARLMRLWAAAPPRGAVHSDP